MNRRKSVPFSGKGLAELDKWLEDYKKWLVRKTDELASKLAALGATSVSLGFAQALYDGVNDVDITVEHRGNGNYAVIASGTTVLIIEFGAGYMMGYGHPEAVTHGMGPGTYPGQTHAFSPYGWWYSENGESRHSYGNPPNMPMYNAVKNLESELKRIVTEVFA